MICCVHAGNFSPALLLKTFVQDIRSALSTVSSLHLHLQRPGNLAVTTIVLQKELALLMAACPTLKSLTLESYVCPVFLQMVSQVCPLVSAVNIQIKQPPDVPHTEETFLQLPSLFPHLTSLGLNSAYPMRHPPDMSQSRGILQLDLASFHFNYAVEWFCMPPRLRHLRCKAISVGPPAMADGRILLPDLQSLKILWNPQPLHAVAQLVRNLPSLQTFCTETDQEICISISFDCSTGDDLRLLAASKLAFLRNPFYRVNCNKDRTYESEVHPFVDSLPLMTGITRCRIEECYSDDLGSVLSVFPDVSRLTLDLISGMDDEDLQVVGGCSKLAELELTLCWEVSAMGVLVLCQRLPGLGLIRSTLCGQLTDITLSRCQRLLGRGLEFTVIT